MIVYIILGLIIIYLLAIMPKMLHRKDMSHYKGYFYAHRGFHKEKSVSPENSLSAFQLALDHNYGIEFDVQLSKDFIPVVFHDYSLKRVCGVEGKVCELTYDELRKLTLFKSNERIPHLKEVLDLINGQVPLIIELKIEETDITLCEIVTHYLDYYHGTYCIESFNPLGLVWFKKNRPNIMRGQLSSHLRKEEDGGNTIRYFALQNLLLNFLTKPDFIAFNYKYRTMISFTICHTLFKVPTFAWTIKSQEALDLSQKSFDFFIFEHFVPKRGSN